MENQEIDNQEVKQETPVEEPIKKEVVDPYKDIFKGEVRKADKDTDLIYRGADDQSYTKIIIPSSGYIEQKNATDKYDEILKDTKDDDNDTYRAILSSTLSVNNMASPQYGTYDQRLNPETFNNNIVIDNKQVNLQSLTADDLSRVGTKSSQDVMLAKYMSLMGGGERTAIPLWHSGFRVFIHPMTSNHLLNFQTNIFKELVEVGKDTHGLLYSNEAGIIHKHAMDLFLSLLQGTTLDIDITKENILDYISILDLNTIYLALISACNSKGVEVTIGCNNITQITEDNKLRCDHVSVGRLNPNKLLWVDLSLVPKFLQKQLVPTTSKSVTKEAAKSYRDEISKIAENNKIIFKSPRTDEDIIFNLKIPTIKEYLEEMNMWVMEITTRIREIMSDQSNNVEKTFIVRMVSDLLALGVYNSYIKSIDIRGEEITDREIILAALGANNDSTNENLDKFLRGVLKYIEMSSVAISAIPNYVCPKCKKEQEGSENPVFKELIPINMTSIFFDQSALSIASLG